MIIIVKGLLFAIEDVLSSFYFQIDSLELAGSIIGYARVSSDKQKIDLQISALTRAGCQRLFIDEGISGSNFNRNGLDEALSYLKPDDMLVVWRLDRLGRSLSGLVQLIDELGRREIHFRSIMENIDTVSPGGRLLFHMMAALAEFELAIIRERTLAGLEEAKRNGKILGRPTSLSPEQLRDAEQAITSSNKPRIEVAKQLNVSVRTLRRQLNKQRRMKDE